jgi:hypothetical protein
VGAPYGNGAPLSVFSLVASVPHMSTIWTPSGEQPIRREDEQPLPQAGPQGADPGREPSEEELAADLDQLRRELAATPAAVVVANHAMGLFELAALHLSQQPPNLSEAQVAIDAMAAMVEGLAGRLGENEPTLMDALAQLRMAYVQLKAAADTPVPPAEG